MLLTDDPHVGALAFATVADWVIGAIVTHHGLVQAARAEPGPRPGVDDPGVVHAEIETITAEERFTEGLETPHLIAARSVLASP